jgi:hypothetical protein
MQIVFKLEHYSRKDDRDSAKYIGYYESKEEAEKAIERTVKLEGFCDCPEGFVIQEIEIDKDLIPCVD